MSRVVVVEKDKDGKIRLTKEELQKMLDDAYNQGHSDGSKYDYITYPSNTRTYPWYYTTITCSDSNKVESSLGNW